MERLKSPVFQVAILTNLLFIFKTFGLFANIGIDEIEYQELVTAITVIVNLIAGANNPLDKEKF